MHPHGIKKLAFSGKMGHHRIPNSVKVAFYIYYIGYKLRTNTKEEEILMSNWKSFNKLAFILTTTCSGIGM